MVFVGVGLVGVFVGVVVVLMLMFGSVLLV